jgi:Tfp pilus assembly protein PilE
MAIKRKSFTLVEILVSILLLGFILTMSIKSYEFLSTNSKINEIRYLVLNKIDSEMNRLVFAYENIDEDEFAFYTNDTNMNWDDYLKIALITDYQEFKTYNNNPLKLAYGLQLNYDNDPSEQNVVEIIDNNNNPNIVDVGDVVGLLGWRIKHNASDANLSLSITYPYLSTEEYFDEEDNKIRVKPYLNIPIETINLKTSTKVKQ